MSASVDSGQLAEVLASLEQRLHRSLSQQATLHGFSEAQTRTLLHLYIAGVEKMKSLSQINDLSAPATTALVEQLALQGLVTRQVNERNRRELLITLTEKGEALAGRLYDDWCEIAERIAVSPALGDAASSLRWLTSLKSTLDTV